MSIHLYLTLAAILFPMATGIIVFHLTRERPFGKSAAIAMDGLLAGAVVAFCWPSFVVLAVLMFPVWLLERWLDR